MAEEQVYPTPSEEAINWIKQHPQRHSDFDAKYGAGSAETINGPYQEPDDGTLIDMFKGAVEGGVNIIRETGQFLNDNFSGANLNPADPAHYGLKRTGEAGEILDQRDQAMAIRQVEIQDTLEDMTIFGQERDTTAGNVTQAMSQFLLGLVGVGKITKLKTFSTISGGLIGGAIVDGVMFDPDDANFVRMLDEQFGIGNETVTELLGNNADDSELEKRLKNAFVGGVVGGSIDGVILGFKAIRAKVKGRKELQETGAISEETTSEIEAIEAEIQSFADLSAKPKGRIVEGKFITDDGMIFDTKSGARDFEAEQVALTRPIDETPPNTVAPNRPDAPEIPATAPKVEVAVPDAPVAPVIKAPKKPTSVVNMSALKKAAVSAKTLNEGQIVQMGDLNQMGDNLGLFNYSKMDGPLDAIKVMDQVQDALNGAGVLKSMNLENPQSLAEVTRLAVKELGELAGDPARVAEQYRTLEAAGRDAAPRIVAGKMALQSTGREIANLVDQLDGLRITNNVDTGLERRLVDMLELHADLQSSIKGMQTAAARAVSAGRIRTADALGDVTLDRLAQYGGSKQIGKLVKQLKGTKGNPAGMAKVIRKAQQRSVMGVVNEVWLNAILSGPRTHMMNIGSNAINMGIRPAQRMAGGAMMMIKKSTREAGKLQIEENFRTYVYTMAELADSIRYLATATKYGNESAMSAAFKSWYREEGLLDTASKFDFDQAGNSRAIGGIAGKIIRGAGRTLQAEDEFFKQTIFRSRLKAKVMTNAARLSEDELLDMGYATKQEYIVDTFEKATLSKEALTEKWEEMVALGRVADDVEAKDEFISNNIGTYNHNSAMAKVALEEAREATFTTPLREGTFSKKVQESLNQFPVLRQIMPFIQTPTNILRVSFERVPVLGLFAGQQLRKLRNGTPDEKSMVLGQQALGWGITLYAVDMAMQGKITGGGPTYNRELNKAKLWNASPDWQPYSVNIGSSEKPNWIELKKLDPHGMLFGIVADFYEMLEYGANDPNPEVAEGLAMVMTAVANNITSKTYLASLTDTLDIFSGGAEDWKVIQFMENRVASMIPYSGLSYQLNQMGDGTMRDMRDFTDKLKARVYSPVLDAAGVDTSYTPKHDWLTGEAVDTPDYMLGFVRQKKVDSGEHRAAKVYEELRNVDHAFTGPQRRLGDVDLPPQVFQEYNELVGTIKGPGRRNLVQALEVLFESRDYKRASEDADVFPVASADDPRTALINGVINAYKSAAQDQLYRKYPKLEAQVNNNIGIRRAISRGGDRELAKDILREFTLD